MATALSKIKMIDLFPPYLMTALLWKRLTTEKIIKNALSLTHNAVKDFVRSLWPLPSRRTASHSSSPEAEAGDPARATLGDAGQLISGQTKRPPIESPASFSAGSDELAMVPQSQSGKGAAQGGD